MSVQIQQLRCVAAVVEHGSFTKAAEALYVAQPSLSKQIRNLETELQTLLFERGNGVVRLTAAGEALLPYVRRILADVAGAKSEVAYVTHVHPGEINVGALQSLQQSLVAPALRDFKRANPSVRPIIHEAPSTDLVESVVRGDIDLAVIASGAYERTSGVAFEALFSEALVLAVGPDDQLLRQSAVSVDDLRDVGLVMSGHGYIQGVTLSACRQAGFEPNVIVEGGAIESAVAFVGAGIGAAVLPARYVRGRSDMRWLRFDPPILSYTIGVARRPVVPSRTTSMFLDALTRIARTISADPA